MTDTSLLNKFEKSLEFKLGEEQKSILLQVFNFLKKDGYDTAVIKGSAGTGKTTICKLIIEYLKYNNINYILTAPTNKSKLVLQSYTKSEVMTLHKLLTLKPHIDILDLDLKDLKFIMDDSKKQILPYKGVLIVDECSMVNEALYNFIISQAILSKCKVIFQGDHKQLAPVKEKNISKTFYVNNIFELTKIYRQDENNPVLDTILELRNNPIYEFKNVISDKGSLILYNDWQSFINDNVNKFKNSDIKLIAYTNRRIEAFNKIIREKIFNNPKEYEINDILVGYDGSKDITNSEEYIVKRVNETQLVIGTELVKAYNLTLEYRYSDESNNFTFNLSNITSILSSFEVCILSKDNDEQKFINIAKHIEESRLKAINAKNKTLANKAWRYFFYVNELFLTPIDLIYNNRVIRKKSIDYGYCITAHKSQSSTYNEILVDMQNIRICYNPEELRQLQYVSLSRTKTNIYMLI